MNKVFKVGLVYINTNNIGDIVIFDTTKYLIKKSLASMGIDNYKIVPIDMGERVAGQSDWPETFAAEQAKQYADAPEFVREWKSTKLYYYFQQNELPKLDVLDLIVFAGGGLIKFHQQYFHMYIDEVTAVAERERIPVIFNAVGIEGYDKSDPRCQCLEAALHRSCVKAISTRDNLAMLQQSYLATSRLTATLVSDPALWVKEAYEITAGERQAVGLGVIRPEIFSLYGVEAPREAFLKFYKMIITALEKEGVEYKLFTNGARRDHRFIEEIRLYMRRGEKFNDHVEKIPKNGKALATIINSYSRLLTCRMHAAVIAYALNIPAVSVVWNKKLEYFAELTEQPDNLIFSKDFEDKSLVMKKILESSAPGVNEAYKNSDYDFIRKYIKRYYRRRYVVKGMRYGRALKHKMTTKSAR
ncbi:MAG TPA: polysaccharide pyruvyl transferase family protein [Candidatus Saccharimonadales bacterium]|nr:polysaccharide pyruvyl transferase family protein [Candidatus Saccharimonadales bacterium]